MFTGSSEPLRALLLALLLLVVLPPRLTGQDGATALLVTVRSAEDGEPLVGARVQVQGVIAQANTNAFGEARLRSLSAGARTVRVSMLGYAPEQSEVVLPLEGGVEVSFELRPQPVRLTAVRVVARERRRSVLETNGFFARKEDGFGTFITREQIERSQVRQLSEMLRRVPGISLRSHAMGGTASASSRGNANRNCPIQYYLDGVLVPLFNVDDVPTRDVEGLEVYKGSSTIPPLFNRGTALCGVIVIWTRVQ